MAAALLDRMDEAGQDGLVAKDLVDWYMASDNCNPGAGTSSGGESTAGSEGKEEAAAAAAADSEADARAAAAAAEMKPQLLSVIRRMIKRDKSIVAVKSTVKGSKRIEDMLLRIRLQAEAADNDNELKVSSTAVVVADAAVAAVKGTTVASPEPAEEAVISRSKSKDNLDEAQVFVPVAVEDEADQMAKLRKQIEEKKALILAKAKAKADIRATEVEVDTATAKAADNAADDPTKVRK